MMKELHTKWGVILGLLMACVMSLNAADSCMLLDPKERLDAEMRDRVEAAQKRFLTDYDCRVSYAIMAGDVKEGDMTTAWKKHTENRGDHFQLLVLIGDYSGSKSVKIKTKNQPVLQDIHEADRIFRSITKDLETETVLKSLAMTSIDLLGPELLYITKNRIELESDDKEGREAAEELQLRHLIINVLKISALVIFVPVALFLCWCIFSRARNKKAYHFPEVSPKQRLGAPYAATSISPIND